MKIQLHPDADDELVASIRYYESRQSGLGDRLYKEVFRQLDWITSYPELPRLRRDHRRVNLTVFPFFIVYVLEGETIFVLAVAHAHRRPNHWRERLNG